MKVDLIRKFKWYIVGFIMCVIMLAVGLSFCTWDNLSITALAAKANTGGFDAVILNEHLTLVDDKNNNGKADVGDIINFGRYYIDAPQINGDQTILPDKTSLRWIIVNIDSNNQATLLTESVIAFGSFWGTYCYDATGTGSFGAADSTLHTYYQNYERSTARAWLNSYSDLRNDGGTNFTKDSVGVFQGFSNIAFNNKELEYITAQDITGMRGSINGKGELEKTDYDPIYGDKVWLPSYGQVFGEDLPFFSDNDCNDGVQSPISNSKFSYFTDNTSRIGKVTAFAITPTGNYTFLGKTQGTKNYQDLSRGGNAFWRLRSPFPGIQTLSNVMTVSEVGVRSAHPTDNSRGGVRPAVCVPLPSAQ